MLSSVIHAHLHELFAGRDVVNYSQFRVTRDADLWIDEEEVKNLRQALQGELPQRQFGSAVRLEVAAACPDRLAQFLLQQFDLDETDLYRCDGPVNLARLASLIDQVDIDALKYEPFVPGLPDRAARRSRTSSRRSAQHDILLHHPYQSFEPVVEFIRRAADDPDVVAIKQTVYRTGVNSVLMEALIEAARRGKEVTVVIELMARFDEEANINWAERLEQAGAQVVYGVFGLKTHAKLALLIRRERDGQRQGAARALRAPRHRQLPSAHDAALHRLRAADRRPRDLPRRQRSVPAHHEPRPGRPHAAAAARAVHDAPAGPRDDPARDAACARRQAGADHRQDERAAGGGRHQRAVRGVAGGRRRSTSSSAARARCVRACPGCRRTSACARSSAASSSITASGISRTPATPDVWLSSADWMGRNLFKRIEVAFPVRDPALAQRVVDEGLQSLSRRQPRCVGADADGAWKRLAPHGRAQPRSAQSELLARMREPATS